MSLPVFFQQELPGGSSLLLSEETSQHIIQVLRMKKGNQLQLSNGKGKLVTAEIISENKKATEVKSLSTVNIPRSTIKNSIGISLIKSTSRFEMFLEKSTEIGVSEIIPLICERTEKQHFRYDRMKNILISAMIQSQQVWLPVLHEPAKFSEVVKTFSYQNKYVAHCYASEKESLIHTLEFYKKVQTSPVLPTADEVGGAVILIGPEGDFTKGEIDLAIQNNFIPVSLGKTRLRTETAGIVAATILAFNK